MLSLTAPHVNAQEKACNKDSNCNKNESCLKENTEKNGFCPKNCEPLKLKIARNGKFTHSIEQGTFARHKIKV